jgi:membrane-associated protease RseP (regulator of RpoE activity)
VILETFEKVKPEAAKDGLVPVITKRGAGYCLYLIEKPEAKRAKPSLNLALLIVTTLSTTLAGAVFAYGYFFTVPIDFIPLFTDPGHLLNGFLYYALPLMTILVVHEAAHFVVAKRSGMNPSLPFFIPIPPPIGFTGTFGAVISVNEPMPSKRALVRVGSSGPLAGFIASVIVVFIGLSLSTSQPGAIAPLATDASSTGTQVGINSPLIYDVLGLLLGVSLAQAVHPVALAGWVGLLVTSIQLLPAGQLDGGHVFRALFGENVKYFAYAVVAVLGILGLTALTGTDIAGVRGFEGWLILAAIVLFTGLAHPPPLDDVTPLTTADKILGIACLVVLVLTFMPQPIVA